MLHRCVLVLILFCTVSSYGQFKFNGLVTEEFTEATCYLMCIEDYKKSHVFQTEYILQESKIDAEGRFQFSGDFLSSESRFYKIYVDKCQGNVSDALHLLKQCEESTSIIFIANNTDHIYFPLNGLDQMFCDVQFSRSENTAIQKIDSIQEQLLGVLQEAKNEAQRNIIFKNYFIKIKHFGRSFKAPLVELYTYNLYANSTSFSRKFYLKDLQNSDYYTKLLHRIEKRYPTASYASQFKADLVNDQYPLLIKKNSSYKIGMYSSLFLLLLSIFLNVFLFTKITPKQRRIQYKEVLSNQEQKVFLLMHDNLSNKEIAAHLFISISTVKTHINAIYKKLLISSRNEIELFFKD